MKQKGVSEGMEYKMVIGVRTDLKLSKGKIAVQVAHAAVMCALRVRKMHWFLFSRWYREGQRKVVVKIKGLEEIYQLESRANDIGIVAEIVQDAGLTEIPPGTITCIGLGPAEEEKIDRLTGKLPLL